MSEVDAGIIMCGIRTYVVGILKLNILSSNSSVNHSISCINVYTIPLQTEILIHYYQKHISILNPFTEIVVKFLKHGLSNTHLDCISLGLNSVSCAIFNELFHKSSTLQVYRT